MALSINWGTSVIYVPKADLTLIQASPEIRGLDLNAFRLELKDLEDSDAGMPFTKTHNHNTEVSLSGIVYARIITVLPPYTVEFEDGQYTVSCTGANHNLADVKVVNQVSLLINNAAGLISNSAIEHSSFRNKVTIDVVGGFSGTTYPTGTPMRPSNNLNDAKQIAINRGFTIIEMLSALTVTAGQSIDDFHFVSENWLVLTVDAGSTCVNTTFTKLSVYGVMSGIWNVMDDCWLYVITNFCGWIRNGTAFVDITLAPYSVASGGASFLDDCLPMIPGDVSVLTMNTDVSVSFTNAHDLFQINGMTANSLLSVGLSEGTLTIDSSCVGGDIVVGGIGELINNSLLVVDDSRLINTLTIAEEIGSEKLDELYKIRGLKLGSSAVISPTSIIVNGIELIVSTVNGVTTVTRQ